MFCFKPRHSSNTLQGLTHHLIGDLRQQMDRDLRSLRAILPLHEKLKGLKCRSTNEEHPRRCSGTAAARTSYPR
ncbi:hypothetical protein NL676_007144 [Syzygium grande]|nr:hypothetical protein NL676_007144 [Syzygium grande]